MGHPLLRKTSRSSVLPKPSPTTLPLLGHFIQQKERLKKSERCSQLGLPSRGHQQAQEDPRGRFGEKEELLLYPNVYLALPATGSPR